MILIVQLDKVERGLYRACVTEGGVEVTEPSQHPSLADALRAVATSVPREFAQFVEPRYCGCCSGTISCEDLAKSAEEIAEQLVALVAQVHRSAEE